MEDSDEKKNQSLGDSGRKETDRQKEGLKEVVRALPQTPGVYLMKNAQEKIIYVGKAKNLRARVRSYFSNVADLSPKTKFLVSHVVSVEPILTKTEVEAFLLEASLIKKYKPRYNIRLRDDKAYPYIRLSADPFPRFYLSRRVVKDRSVYFGPYTSGSDVFETIAFINRTFLIRDCRDAFFKSRKRPCITHQIGRCSAPCVSLVSQEQYASDVEAATLFLRGKDRTVVKELTQRMKTAAVEERFEAAARFRDSLLALEKILDKQTRVIDSSDLDQDVIGYYGDERGTTIEVVHLRKGRVVGTRAYFQPLLDVHSKLEDPREWLVSFVNQYYEENVIPDELLVPVDLGFDLFKLLQDVLVSRREEPALKERSKDRSSLSVVCRFPGDEVGSRLLELADRSAMESFKRHVSKSEVKQTALIEIQRKFSLPQIPLRMECFDISHFQGAETVASQVVFEDGVPAKDHYRRYKLRTVKGPDDFESMREVLTRRLGHREYDDPQLIVIDGGKGQLGIAVQVLAELRRSDIPVVAMAKARTERDFEKTGVVGTEERFFLPGRVNPVTFQRHLEALHILVALRDEAHRFAISYHRKLREATSLESELDAVGGLGEKRRLELLKVFKSVEDLRQATVEEISAVKGFDRRLAERVLNMLHQRDLEFEAVREDS